MVSAQQPAIDLRSRQTHGIQVVDEYLDHYRKTGDRDSLRPSLQSAEAELKTSADGFVARKEWASAALSAQKVGDIERLMENWDRAFDLYTSARTYAERANRPAYQAKALSALAMVEHSRENLSAANEYVSEAIRVATVSNNKDGLFRSLDVAAELEVSRRNLIAANEYLNRALSMSKEIQDRAELVVVYLDRADVYEKRGERCESYGNRRKPDSKQKAALFERP